MPETNLLTFLLNLAKPAEKAERFIEGKLPAGNIGYHASGLSVEEARHFAAARPDKAGLMPNLIQSIQIGIPPPDVTRLSPKIVQKAILQLQDSLPLTMEAANFMGVANKSGFTKSAPGGVRSLIEGGRRLSILNRDLERAKSVPKFRGAPDVVQTRNAYRSAAESLRNAQTYFRYQDDVSGPEISLPADLPKHIREGIEFYSKRAIARRARSTHVSEIRKMARRLRKGTNMTMEQAMVLAEQQFKLRGF